MDSGCVGIVGLGLIGGSIGLDLLSQGIEVQGLVHRSATAERAMQRGLGTAVSTDPSCLAHCDLVIRRCRFQRCFIRPRSWWRPCPLMR